MTVLDVPKHNQRLDEEPMDLSAMQSVITSMEEELLAVSDGKKLDKSKISQITKIVHQIINLKSIIHLNMEERTM